MTRKIDRQSGEIWANVGRSGSAGLEWVVDYDGRFTAFTSLGLIPPTLLQRLGITLRQERYRMEFPRQITVGELLALAKPLIDPFPEARVGLYLRKTLRSYPADRFVDREVMRDAAGM